VALTVAHQSRTQLPKSLSTLISDCFKVKLFYTTGAGDARLAAQEVTGSWAQQAKDEIMQFRTGEAFLTMHGAATRRIATFQAIDPPVPLSRLRMLQTTALRHYGRPSKEVAAEIRSRLQLGRDDNDNEGGGYRHGKRPDLD
jgi:hypothetical protein